MRMLVNFFLNASKRMEELGAKEIALSDEVMGAGDERGTLCWHHTLVFNQITSWP